MSGLSAFLAQNVLPAENEKYVASKRSVDNGEPVEWELRCITSAEDEQLRKKCRKRTPGRRKQQPTVTTDTDEYLGELGAACVVYPNLADAELQNSFGVLGAPALLKAMLLPGEYADLLEKIQEMNGFDITFEDEVEEAKN